MAETKTILIDLEAKYDSIRAIGRMSDLSMEINATKTLIKAQGDVTKENSVAVVRLKTELKAMQKEYNRLNGYVATSAASARAYGYALKESESLPKCKGSANGGHTGRAWTQQGRASDFGVALKAQIDSLTKTLFDNSTPKLDKNKQTTRGLRRRDRGANHQDERGRRSRGDVASVLRFADEIPERPRLPPELNSHNWSTVDSFGKPLQEVQRLGKELDQLNLHMGGNTSPRR